MVQHDQAQGQRGLGQHKEQASRANRYWDWEAERFMSTFCPPGRYVTLRDLDMVCAISFAAYEHDWRQDTYRTVVTCRATQARDREKWIWEEQSKHRSFAAQ